MDPLLIWTGDTAAGIWRDAAQDLEGRLKAVAEENAAMRNSASASASAFSFAEPSPFSNSAPPLRMSPSRASSAAGLPQRRVRSAKPKAEGAVALPRPATSEAVARPKSLKGGGLFVKVTGVASPSARLTGHEHV